MQTLQTLKFVKNDSPKWSTGTVSTPVGPVFRASSDWSNADRWGMIKSRIGAFRMNYFIAPGLYAIGNPQSNSDVFVTANYKLTFDILRRELMGMNVWILVLDTKSINVWCAAGKGTFGTEELIRRIADSKLDAVVSHRKLILPQLGAVGVSASDVQRKTGFRVVFGPVHARDISPFVKAGYKKTNEMSTIQFSMLDRLVLTPMELNPAMGKFPWVAAGILLVFGLQPSGVLFRQAWSNGLPFLLLALLSVLSGAFITPILLPFIPSRSFAVKGWIVGILSMLVVTMLMNPAILHNGPLLAAAWLFFPAMSSYIALQFTGSTTFTGMTGVRKELKISIPIYIGTAGTSLILLIFFKITEWGLI